MLAWSLMHWSIRLALVCFAARLALWLLGRDRLFAASRAVWTLGCGLFVLHVASAFQFKHHWQHVDAFKTTAQRTEEMLGVRFGEGIYFSYLFLVLWIADVAWQWLAAEHYRRHSRTVSLVLAYMAFIAFNGAVVFEGGPTRWVGIAFSLVLAIAFVFTRLIPSRRRQTAAMHAQAN
jgi:hypothetical protein